MWQPIETAPKDGTLVICSMITGGRAHWARDAKYDGLAWYTRNGKSVTGPTHWMPLPEPPEAK